MMHWESQYDIGENDEKTLLERQGELKGSLAGLEKDIYSLESLHLSRWEGGNLLLPFDPSIRQSKRGITEIPPSARIFSCSDAFSRSDKDLDSKNRRIIPS